MKWHVTIEVDGSPDGNPLEWDHEDLVDTINCTGVKIVDACPADAPKPKLAPMTWAEWYQNYRLDRPIKRNE